MALNFYITDGEKILKKSNNIVFTQDEIVEEHEDLVDTLKEHQARMPKRDKKLDKLIKEQSKELATYKKGEKEDLEKARTLGAKDKQKRKEKPENMSWADYLKKVHKKGSSAKREGEGGKYPVNLKNEDI